MVNGSAGTIIKSLEPLLRNHYTIAIIGIAKNAGKTTVLNKIIETYRNQPICITSIGLDGEQLDNITRLEKPRIQAYPGMYVITTEQCLKESTIKFIIHERTDIRTALGNVMIVEVTVAGRVLVAGPASKQRMMEVITMVKKYQPCKILIDGALFRKSIASAEVSDGIVFVTGASYNPDMSRTIQDTKTYIDHIQKKALKLPQKMYENMNENIIVYNETNDSIVELQGNFLNESERLVHNIDTNTTHMYLPGALTDQFAEIVIQNHKKVNNLIIIVQDISYSLISQQNSRKLARIPVHIGVLNPIDLLFVAYNPVSPFSYDYDEKEFRAQLSDKLGFEPINVLQDLG